MISATLPGRALYDPVDGAAAAVQGRRWVWPLLLLILCTALSGAAFALRWDATSKIVAELSESGDLARSSEREVNEKIETAERVRLVAGVAKGIFLPPLSCLLLAVVLKLAAWLLGRKAKFIQAFTAATVAMLPLALFHLVFAMAAFRQAGVTEAQVATLVPSSLLALAPDAGPKLSRVLGSIDFFNLWAAVLLGLGFSSATGMGKARSVALGVSLYAMYAGVFMIGLPGLVGGGK